MKNIEKMVYTSMLTAFTVATSHFVYIPIGFVKIFPVQHFVNVISAVLLGPSYAVMQALLSSTIRNLVGTGSVFAFPGSLIGALLAAYSYRAFRKVSFAAIGEVIGTGIFGALATYPIGIFLLGEDVTVFGLMPAFLLSSFGGAILAYGLLTRMIKHQIIGGIQDENSINNRRF